ncbi:MAG: hypothetical protein V3T31_04295 [candidate division Zixibacteria bacterium]
MANIVKRPDSTYPVIIKPYKLDMSQFGDKVRDEVTFTIENVSDVDLTLDIIAGRPDLFDVDLPDKIEAGETGEATLKLTSEGVEDNWQKSFTFQVGDETHTRFTVPVKRTIRQPGNAKPAAGYGKKGK